MIKSLLLTIAAFLFALSSANASNQILNGDFSAGNTGFATAYNYVAPTFDALLPPAVYTIAANPHTPIDLNHFGTADYFDHTLNTASGTFMIVNGATSADSIVWQQTVTSLQTNTSYYFSTWVSSWTAGAPAALQLKVNGIAIGSPFTAPTDAGVWIYDEQLFNTGPATSATFQVFNLQTAFSGNDFGLDDLRLDVTPIPEPASALLLLLVAVFGCCIRRVRAPRCS